MAAGPIVVPRSGEDGPRRATFSVPVLPSMMVIIPEARTVSTIPTCSPEKMTRSPGLGLLSEPAFHVPCCLPHCTRAGTHAMRPMAETPAWRQTHVAKSAHHASQGPNLVQLEPGGLSRWPNWLWASATIRVRTSPETGTGGVAGGLSIGVRGLAGCGLAGCGLAGCGLGRCRLGGGPVPPVVPPVSASAGVARTRHAASQPTVARTALLGDWP